MNITNLYISGLNTFQVVGSNYDAASQTYTLYMDTPTTQLLGEYSMTTNLTVAGVPIQMFGNGFLDIESVDGRVVITCQFGANSKGQLTMTSLKFHDMSCGQFNVRNTGFMNNDNFSNFLNSVTEDGMGLLNAQMAEVVMTPYADMLMDTFNPLLKYFTTVDQLTKALIAGTGNSTEGLFGLPLCN